MLSWPHLLWADTRYTESVIGLHPDEEKHTGYLILEPVSMLLNYFSPFAILK